MGGIGKKVIVALLLVIAIPLAADAGTIQIGSFMWGEVAPGEKYQCQIDEDDPSTCYAYTVENTLSGLNDIDPNALSTLNLLGSEAFGGVFIQELGGAGNLGDIYGGATAYSTTMLVKATVILGMPGYMVGTLLPAVFDLTDPLYDPGIYVESSTAVPEPGTLGCLALGASVVLAARRRQRVT